VNNEMRSVALFADLLQELRVGGGELSAGGFEGFVRLVFWECGHRRARESRALGDDSEI